MEELLKQIESAVHHYYAEGHMDYDSYLKALDFLRDEMDAA